MEVARKNKNLLQNQWGITLKVEPCMTTNIKWIILANMYEILRHVHSMKIKGSLGGNRACGRECKAGH